LNRETDSSLIDPEMTLGAVRRGYERFSDIAEKTKEILLSGVIGPVTGVDFHRYLDVRHGRKKPGYASLPACNFRERQIYRNRTWIRIASASVASIPD